MTKIKLDLLNKDDIKTLYLFKRYLTKRSLLGLWKKNFFHANYHIFEWGKIINKNTNILIIGEFIRKRYSATARMKNMLSWDGVFSWSATKEGWEFWHNVYEGFHEFHEKEIKNITSEQSEILYGLYKHTNLL